MLREVLGGYPNVRVDSFEGLLVDHAAAHGATILLRGIRAISDYEYELQMALMNRRLRPGIETLFLMANEAYSFISSRLVKEVFSLGGNISGLVPPCVEARLQLPPSEGSAQRGLEAYHAAGAQRNCGKHRCHRRFLHHESGGGGRKSCAAQAWTWPISEPASRISPRPTTSSRPPSAPWNRISPSTPPPAERPS